MRNTHHATGVVLLLGLLVGPGCTGGTTATRDLQVMSAAAKAESQQTQRALLDLRAEIQALQRDLGTARAMQARVEGELREAQRRVTEAQRVVDVQREELTRAREERERAAQAGREAQGQLVELGRLRQQAADAARGQTRLQSLEAALEKQNQDIAELKATVQASVIKPKSKTATAGRGAVTGKSQAATPPPAGESSGSSPRKVTVQPGDTLVDLAKRHRVDSAELKALNKLSSDRLIPGQELMLPDSKG